MPEHITAKISDEKAGMKASPPEKFRRFYCLVEPCKDSSLQINTGSGSCCRNYCSKHGTPYVKFSKFIVANENNQLRWTKCERLKRKLARGCKQRNKLEKYFLILMMEGKPHFHHGKSCLLISLCLTF